MTIHFKLGDGFNTLFKTFKKSALEPQSLKAIAQQIEYRGQTSYKVFENTEDLKSHLASSNSLSLTKLGFDLQANLNLSRDEQSTHKDLFHLFSYEKLERIESLDLNQCQLPVLDENEDQQGFYQSYGDAFVREIRHGKQVLVMVHYKIDNSEYNNQVNGHLDVFFKTGVMDAQLNSLLTSGKMSFEFYSLLQGIEFDLFIDDLADLKPKLNALIAATNTKEDSIPLEYHTYRYEELNPSLFVGGVSDQRFLQEMLSQHVEQCQNAMRAYQQMLEQEKSKHTGAIFERWCDWEQDLNDIQRQLVLVEHKVARGVQATEVQKTVADTNEISDHLNAWLRSVTQAQSQVIFSTQVFERASSKKYRSDTFKLDLPKDMRWLAFDFNGETLRVDLQFKFKFLTRSNVLLNLVPNKKLSEQHLEKLLELSQLPGKFSFKVKHKQGNPFTLERGETIQVMVGTQATIAFPPLGRLVWSGSSAIELASPRSASPLSSYSSIRVASPSSPLKPLSPSPSAPQLPLSERVARLNVANSVSCGCANTAQLSAPLLFKGVKARLPNVTDTISTTSNAQHEEVAFVLSKTKNFANNVLAGEDPRGTEYAALMESAKEVIELCEALETKMATPKPASLYPSLNTNDNQSSPMSYYRG